MTTEKKVFVTGWFRRHGVAYFDMVLRALESARAQERLASPNEGETIVDGADQHELARAAGYGPDLGSLRLKAWAKAIMLVPKRSRANEESRIQELVGEEKWQRVLRSVEKAGGWGGWPRDYEKLRLELKSKRAFPPLGWFRTNWAEGGDHAIRSLWHVINEAPLATQVEWYRASSPLLKANGETIEICELDLPDSEDPVEVTRTMDRWLASRPGSERYVVNLWGTSTAVQFGWYFLAWSRPALKNAVFVRCETPGPKKERFVPIRITHSTSNPIAALEDPHPTGAQAWWSTRRRYATDRLKFTLGLDDNFSILILGPRGSGKSSAVRDAWRSLRPDPKARPYVATNCANFVNLEHARSELFGHAKGAFTGATKPRKGLFAQANNGLLFLDEVHRLGPEARAMLLTALQTDEEGYFTYTPLGDSEPKKTRFQPVFAANVEFKDLSDGKIDDFVDRISQRVIELPGIAPDELSEAWSETWKRMDFKPAAMSDPIDELKGIKGFPHWLRQQALPGNFRDLQHIAILVADYRRAQTEAGEVSKGLGPDLFVWLDKELGRKRPQQAQPPERPDATPKEVASATDFLEVPVDLENGTPDEILAACRSAYAQRLKRIHGNGKAAVKALRSRGAKTTEATFSRWLKDGKK